MNRIFALALASGLTLAAFPVLAHGVFAGGSKASAVPIHFRPLTKSVEGKVDKPIQAVFVLTINQLDGHISGDAPFKITLDGTGLDLSKATLSRAEAVEGDKHEAKLLTFNVPIVGRKAGTYQVNAVADFSMCTAKNCTPKHQTTALQVVVKPS